MAGDEEDVFVFETDLELVIGERAPARHVFSDVPPNTEIAINIRAVCWPLEHEQSAFLRRAMVAQAGRRWRTAFAVVDVKISLFLATWVY